MSRKILCASMFVAVLALSGCADTWSNSSVERVSAGPVTKTGGTVGKVIDPAQVIITKEDITDRPYTVIADIETTVNKTTIFHADPTPAMIDEKFREEAVKLGADAVILVRYGSVGVSLMSWGSLDGKGRAVAFNN